MFFLDNQHIIIIIFKDERVQKKEGGRVDLKTMFFIMISYSIKERHCKKRHVLFLKVTKTKTRVHFIVLRD